jgi:CxxC motif-containing protein (DUF1111 family)
VSASATEAETVGTVVLEDAHPPHTWRPVTPDEQKKFDLGYAAFNTQWSAANSPAGRTDGLGPLFNVQSCDACHNSRRRGRGPRGSGDAPGDLVVQLGRLQPDGRVERGTPEYGRILNTNAVAGFTPEASVSITYADQVRKLADGTEIRLRIPLYTVSKLTGPELPPDTVLIPRMPPSVMGVGLLERVPDSALIASGSSDAHRPSGRFGWQATEPSIASQTASAFGREMGLTTQLNPQADCGGSDARCLFGPNGGDPEVDDELFEAVVLFQKLHAVPVPVAPTPDSEGARIFRETGCATCHKPDLPVELPDHSTGTIYAYTDLLLHDMGDDLADRTLNNKRVHSEWRTAPLWGISASFASSQTLRLLHDGRARTIEEAVLWHGGAASRTRAFRHARHRSAHHVTGLAPDPLATL